MNRIKVAPSLLAADFGNLGSEIRRIEEAGCDWVHLDIMDGHFVPNISFGPFVVEKVRKLTRLTLDSHLMISEPLKYVKPFADAGSDYITVHEEPLGERLAECLGVIRSLGARPGVSINPATPVSKIRTVLDLADLVLVMAVNPGFCGQAFMPEVLDKVRELRGLFKKEIAVDGGVSPRNSRKIIEAGADILVAGSAFFSAKNMKTIVDQFRKGREE